MENSKIQFLKKSYLLFMAMLAFTLIVHAQTANDNPRKRLWQAFLTPPDSIRVGCYYYWVNEQVDPTGVVADLEWLKRKGVKKKKGWESSIFHLPLSFDRFFVIREFMPPF